MDMDMEILGYILMCVRMKLSKDKKGSTELESVKARVARGQIAKAIIEAEMNRLRVQDKEKEPFGS